MKKPKELKKNNFIKKFKMNRRKIYKIQPKKEITNLKIVYFHGGAYLGGITKFHWKFINEVCKRTNATVIFPDYPLVPKNTYKEVFDFSEKLYKQEVDENTILIGDSAGGGISLALSEKMQKEGYKIPKKIILISPWLDITLQNKKIDEIQKYDKVLNKKALRIAGEIYCGRENQNNYLVSPINASIEKLDNIIIFTGTHDILNPDVHVFLEKHKEKNLKIYETIGAPHNWIVEDIKNFKNDFEKFINTILE